ncbi:MAG TPA: cyclopropane-fatty-acyl-phospholipid synthase family protein [Chloroflexota bacterium]|nr:cyclopropane-fatty-acyl-phospholipid synthase family protein [Chloroflexota bacterium]
MSAERDQSTKAEAPVTHDPAGGNLHDTATTLAVLDRVLANYGNGKRDFAIRLWDGTTVPADPSQESHFTLVLNRPGTLRRIMLPPNELALGEAFLDGDYDLEGDIIAAMRLGDVFEELTLRPMTQLSLAIRMLALPRKAPPNGHESPAGVNGRQRARLRGAEHSKARDRKAIAYHYDLGNDFYQLFLDRRMVYSCGYFPTGQEDLDDAQAAKLDHSCRKLRLQPGERLLDIGCGWGGLIIHAAERFGVQALGITLSQPQADLANQRIAEAGLADRCRAQVVDYRDLESQGPFDKIVSVGMVEHVGRANLRRYFESAWRGLKPGGLFLNHGITAAAKDVASYNPLDRFVFQKGAFVRKYIFPDGELIPLGDTLGVAERAGFEVRDVESLREHYILTLRHWVKRLESNRDAVLRLVDERTYRTWRLYMAGCCHSFEAARLSVHQSLLAKPDERGRCPLPWSRSDLYVGES